MKIGIEAEGKLKGLRTLFVGVDDIATQKGFAKVEDICSDEQILQIYISDPENCLDMRQTRLNVLAQDYALTVERSVLTGTPPPRIQIMLRLIGEEGMASMKYLRPTDQVKLSKDKYTWVIPVECMITSCPEDIEGDIEV